MKEFDIRYADKGEKSFLFEILRRVGRLEIQGVLAATAPESWMVWDSNPDPSGGSGLGLARA